RWARGARSPASAGRAPHSRGGGRSVGSSASTGEASPPSRGRREAGTQPARPRDARAPFHGLTRSGHASVQSSCDGAQAGRRGRFATGREALPGNTPGPAETARPKSGAPAESIGRDETSVGVLLDVGLAGVY